MKTFATIILTVFFAACIFTANAQIDNSYVKQNPNAPEISFDKMVHNFGAIKKGKAVTYKFSFKNTGKSPLILSNVKTSCDCTSPDWPKQPVLPGKSATITVGFDAKEKGVFNKTITITSNAKSNLVELTIQGDVFE